MDHVDNVTQYQLFYVLFKLTISNSMDRWSCRLMKERRNLIKHPWQGTQTCQFLQRLKSGCTLAYVLPDVWVLVSVSLQVIFQETLHFCYIWHDGSSGENSFDNVEKACFPRSGLLRPLHFQVWNWSKVIRRWDDLDLKFVFAFACQVIRNFTETYDWMPILASNPLLMSILINSTSL